MPSSDPKAPKRDEDGKRYSPTNAFPEEAFPEDVFPSDIFPSDIFPRQQPKQPKRY